MPSIEELVAKTKMVRDVYFEESDAVEDCTLNEEDRCLFNSMERFHRLSHTR
jgi:hypothetical protein